MKLYEFEGHKILGKAGIESPFFIVCQNLEEVEQAMLRLQLPLVAKVQTLSGKRGKRGGVKVCKTKVEVMEFCKKFFGAKFNDEEIIYIELCNKVEIEAELYVSITYDTVLKIPFL